MGDDHTRNARLQMNGETLGGRTTAVDDAIGGRPGRTTTLEDAIGGRAGRTTATLEDAIGGRRPLIPVIFVP